MRRLPLQLAAAAVVTALIGTGVMVVVFFGAAASSAGAQDAIDTGSCLTVIDAGAQPAALAADQLANARVIAETGARLRVPSRAVVIALATAMQESGLRNLTYGDRDSLGLFQQRPSAGWGTRAQILDPATSATKFFTALLKVPGWQGMPLTWAAQAVQRSAYPNAYAQWESMATTLTGTTFGLPTAALASCQTVADVSLPAGVIGTMLEVALAQQGKPYVWGGVGPAVFDCSGLIVYAWEQAGHPLTVRTAAEMFDVSTPIAPGQEQPGDLLFTEFGRFGPGHVMLVVTPSRPGHQGEAVEAPHAGDVVRLQPYDPRAWRIGRLKPAAFQQAPAAA